MKCFLFKVLICLVASGMVFGCSLGKRFKAISPSEPGAKFDAEEMTEYVKNQDEVYEQIKLLAGFQRTAPEQPVTDPTNAEEWQRFIRAGISYADDKCEVYMGSIFDLNRAKNAVTNEISLMAAATAGVLAAADAAAKEVTITAIAFGLAGASIDNLANSFLYDLEPSGVRSLVEGLQTLYVGEMAPTVNDRTIAFDYIRGYATICVPANIEAEINNAVKTAKGDAKKGTATSAPKVSVNPQVINIRGEASKTQVREKDRIEKLYISIDALTGDQAIALAGNMPFKDEGPIAAYIQAVDSNNIRSKDEKIAKQLLKSVVILTGKTEQNLEIWEAVIKKAEQSESL